MLRVTHDWQIRDDVLADLGRINVNVRDRCLWRIGAHVPRDAVVEAHADANEQISRLDRAIHMLPAVHAHVAIREWVGLINDADAEQRPGDWNLCRARQLEQLALCTSDQHAVPCEDDWALRASDRFSEQFDLAWMTIELRLISRKPRLNLCD